LGSRLVREDAHVVAANVQLATSTKRRWLAALRPLDSGQQDIRSLDGLRAFAALSVLLYHALAWLGTVTVVFGFDVTFVWFYTESGVDLFFVLSGFLLFLPYARAILSGRALPSARLFYKRRALRILPAYWTCLFLLVVLNLSAYLTPLGLKNIAAHLVLLHDEFPPLNRTIEGPFWTLAVEAQFYLLLPLIAWIIARLVGDTRSVGKLLGCVVGFIALQLAWREVEAIIAVREATMPHTLATISGLALRVLDGAQGKFLEVFGLGMLCAVIYVAANERLMLAAQTMRRLGFVLLGCSIAAYVILAPIVVAKRDLILAPPPEAMEPRGLETVFGPFVIGLGYGALLLAVLWGPRLLRAVFEAGPLRFVGLISYSLYLWHEPVLDAVLPHLRMASLGLQAAVDLAVGVFVAIPVAYMSYQLVERPFLRRRARTAASTSLLAQPELAR
jgi:peptidoglycan/LPS O-acetylase OafA/YrhL